MTCATWTTDEQCKWFEEHLPGWTNAQDNGATKTYHSKALGEWYQLFPLEAPMGKELAAHKGNNAKAKQAKKAKMTAVSYLCSLEGHT